MKYLELDHSELQDIIGGSEAHTNLGYVVGYVAQSVSNFIDWLAASSNADSDLHYYEALPVGVQ
jgi:hypothetical protein